jgi:hypothetical protein
VRACSIRLLDKTGARLNVAAVYGLSDAYVKKGDLVLEQNPLAREVIAGKTIIVNDVANQIPLRRIPVVENNTLIGRYPLEKEREAMSDILKDSTINSKDIQ